MANLIEQRLQLQSQAGCRFVTADEFLGMMTSRVPFVRADEPSANLLGLLNEQTGNRILVAEEDFFRVRDAFAQLN